MSQKRERLFQYKFSVIEQAFVEQLLAAGKVSSKNDVLKWGLHLLMDFNGFKLQALSGENLGNASAFFKAYAAPHLDEAQLRLALSSGEQPQTPNAPGTETK